MRKRLEVETLEVESFTVADAGGRRGTVKGREYSSGPIACDGACVSNGCYTGDCYSEFNCMTQDATCGQTCLATCEYSCLCASNEIACIDG